MKKLSIFLGWLLVAGIASAAPYIVYSGTITGNRLTPDGPSDGKTLIYLVADVADSSNFAVLLVDPFSHLFAVVARPGDDPNEDPQANFIGDIGTGSNATGVFSFDGTGTPTSTTTPYGFYHAYATGPLVTHTTTLVPSRKSEVVQLRSDGANAGTYTFSSPTPEITNDGMPYAKSFDGVAFGYLLNWFYEGSQLAAASDVGKLSLQQAPDLTALVNIGGGYAPDRRTAFAILPLAIPAGQSESDALATWLSAFAESCGYVTPPTFSLDVSPFGVLEATRSDLTFQGLYTGKGPQVINSGKLQVDNGACVNVVCGVAALNATTAAPLTSVLAVGGNGIDLVPTDDNPPVPPGSIAFDLTNTGALVTGKQKPKAVLTVAADLPALAVPTIGVTSDGNGGLVLAMPAFTVNPAVFWQGASNNGLTSGYVGFNFDANSNSQSSVTCTNCTLTVDGYSAGYVAIEDGSMTFSGGVAGAPTIAALLAETISYNGGNLSITTNYQ